MAKFLMHRVELKEENAFAKYKVMLLFLMHRVELKVMASFGELGLGLVPNAPCGVESLRRQANSVLRFRVPNAPCGVESS